MRVGRLILIPLLWTALAAAATVERTTCIDPPDAAPNAKGEALPEYERVTQGDVLGITLMIEFQDVQGQLSYFDVEPFLNVPGYRLGDNTASVYEYYNDVSQGRLRLKHWVPRFPYVALHDKAYYAFPETSGSGGVDELLLEALNALEAQGTDFARFDANGDGYIDALSALYAGSATGALGPHAGGITDFEADGVRTRRYQITPFNGALNVAMFVHEVGHMMYGWRDYYDVNFDSAGIGEYCLMSYGTYPGDPVHPSAYLKDDVGWSDTVTLTEDAVDLAAPHPAFTVYRFNHPYNPDEYFMIENRRRAGRDARIPADGLAIWHIDRNGSSRYNEMTPERHFIVSLEQADGRFDLERDTARGDSGDLFGAPNPDRFAPDTLPDTRWWDGSESNMTIYDISAPGALMHFSFAFDPQVLPVEPYVFQVPARYYLAEYGVGTFELKTQGEGETPWEVTASEPWVEIRETPFHVSKGTSTYIYFGVDTALSSQFAPGEYTAEITFTHPGDGRFWKRQVVMQIFVDPNGPVSADYDANWRIGLSELLRLIQFYNSPGYHCDAQGEDGYAAGSGADHDCLPTSADYKPQDWRIDLSELLRYIQIYNVGGYERSEGTEDGIAPTPDPFVPGEAR